MAPMPSTTPSSNTLHLARPGHFTDLHGQMVAVTPALLAQLAASYDPAIHRAPLVIGHPQTNHPAFGWLAAVRAQDDGLYGDPVQVDPAFAAAVNAGRYPHRSLSFWPADHPGSPTPGQPYIRHLGVLGAVPPAIPGLQGADLAGADPAGVLTLMMKDEGGGMKEEAPPACLQPSSLLLHPSSFASEPIMPEASPETVDLAARTADLAAREAATEAQTVALAATAAELERRAQALADQEQAARRAEIVAFAERLADEARIRPGDIPALTEIVLRLDATPAAVCFAAATAPAVPAPGAGWLRGFLAGLPPLVELAAVATKRRAKGAPSPADDQKIARRARAFKAAADAAGNPISFAAAVSAVEADEDLTHVA